MPLKGGVWFIKEIPIGGKAPLGSLCKNPRARPTPQSRRQVTAMEPLGAKASEKKYAIPILGDPAAGAAVGADSDGVGDRLVGEFAGRGADLSHWTTALRFASVPCAEIQVWLDPQRMQRLCS